jgi:hypothetical protein
MLFCRVAVNSKTAALQHRNTTKQKMTPNALLLTITISYLKHHPVTPRNSKALAA